jgi:NAD(P)-dependent dehydrogenase (short-subunit alcohol dehydrogenase family)
MAVNVTGVWLGLKYVIPAMGNRGGGSIVITSSTAGIGGTAGMSAYVTSKHAVIGMMRTAALECAPLGIRVNTVNPAPIETRMMRSLEEMRVAAADSLEVTVERTKQAYEARIPLQRYGDPEEVAKLMLFLASDESSFCTGGVYMVDGGRSAGTKAALVTSEEQHQLRHFLRVSIALEGNARLVSLFCALYRYLQTVRCGDSHLL